MRYFSVNVNQAYFIMDKHFTTFFLYFPVSRVSISDRNDDKYNLIVVYRESVNVNTS